MDQMQVRRPSVPSLDQSVLREFANGGGVPSPRPPAAASPSTVADGPSRRSRGSHEGESADDEGEALAAKKPTDSSYYGLPEDFDVLEARTNDGLTPLHKAAQMGQLQSVELLTAEKAEANALDKNGKSPLDYAEMGDHKQIADYLIKQGGLRGIAVRKKQKQAEQKAAATPRDATPTAA